MRCDACSGVHEEDHNPVVELCPKHAATNDLLAACKAVVSAWEHGDLAAAARKCAAAVAKAKGGVR
jgi:hypothetical protein